MSDKEKAKEDLLEWIGRSGIGHGESDMDSYILRGILNDAETFANLLNSYIQCK